MKKILGKVVVNKPKRRKKTLRIRPDFEKVYKLEGGEKKYLSHMLTSVHTPHCIRIRVN